MTHEDALKKLLKLALGRGSEDPIAAEEWQASLRGLHLPDLIKGTNIASLVHALNDLLEPELVDTAECTITIQTPNEDPIVIARNWTGEEFTKIANAINLAVSRIDDRRATG